MKKVIYFCFIAMSIVFFIGCASTAKRLDTEKDLVADTGELTSSELQKAAVLLAKKIVDYFKKHPSKDGIFVALLPTKNDTSDQLPVKDFDNTLVNELRKGDVFTILTETRKQSLKEIEFSMTGLTEKPLSVGKMKSPNFFIKTDITENMYRHKGDKIVEQVINIELVNVETQVAVWGDRIKYRKKAVSPGGLGW